MRILLLEDRATFAESLERSLSDRAAREILGPVGVQVTGTELEFMRRLPDLVREDFQVAIFDVMVCYCQLEDLATLDPNAIPEEVRKERDGKQKWRAGIRCQQAFVGELAKAGKKPVPCLFYSVLDGNDLRDDLPAGVPLVVKQGDISSLITEIKRLTQ